MKPIIGITCHGDMGSGRDGPERYVLNHVYVESIRRAGAAVAAVPSCTNPELLRPVYSILSGLLLSGGGDIRPERYGQPSTGMLIDVDPERDEAEILLARWAMEDDLPILAICRGIQVLNVALGGTLIQDVPSQVPGALTHHPGLEQPRWQPQHPVRLVPGSRLAAILGQGQPLAQVEVNSFHHQAAREVAPSLRAVAHAPDGVIEGLECPDRTFAIGVQWHPEEMAASSAVQQALFTAFVGATAAKGMRG